MLPGLQSNVLELVMTAVVGVALVAVLDFAAFSTWKNRPSLISELVHFAIDGVRSIPWRPRRHRLPRARLLK
jgi:hypothetical protein